MNTNTETRAGRNETKEKVTEAGGERNETLKRVGIVGAIALAAFLLGLIPMWLSARNTENEAEATRRALRLSVLQNNLATAAIQAGRGEFEPARQQTSDFYTALRAEFDREPSAFNARQREAVQPFLNGRDETITLLAREDASAAGRLADLYFNFMQMKNSVAPADAATASPGR
jgi:hypothetical protein